MFTSEANAISAATNWREAAESLIAYWAEKGRCFSSGEIAAVLRTHRRDLRFSVTVLGEHLRNLFYLGDLPKYLRVTDEVVDADDEDDDDAVSPVGTSPVQHSRYTEGNVGRTPAGVLVFVYGPSVAACDVHEFEVNIPSPGNPALDDGPATPAPKRDIPASVTTVNRPVPPASELPMAYVGPDHRCYLARKVVDAYLGTANISLQQGDALYVTFGDDKVTVTGKALDATSVAYNIWKGSGRVAFYSNTDPYDIGDKYPITVTAAGIEIDFSGRN